jgi:putative transposase
MITPSERSIESFWSSLKYELIYHHRFATQAEARTAIFDYIETFYNRTRLHSSLAYTSPIHFESNLNNQTKELVPRSLSE